MKNIFMKKCRICRQKKTYDEFYFMNPEGFRTECKVCWNKLNAIRNKRKKLLNHENCNTRKSSAKGQA